MLKTKHVKGVLVVSFNIDLIGEEQLEKVWRELRQSAVDAESYGRKLLVNFAGVKGMCSAMIGKLVILTKFCKDRNVDLKMCNLSPDLFPPSSFGFLSGGDPA